MIVAGSAVFKPGADMREVMEGLRRSVRKYGHGEGAEEARPVEAKALADGTRAEEARPAASVPEALAAAEVAC